MREKQGLSARELLEGAYGIFKADGREIMLPSDVPVEITNSQGWYRTPIDYKSATLLNAGGKWWAVAFGVKRGGYPMEPYSCDIAAVRLCNYEKSDERVAIEIRDTLKANSHLCNSLIYALVYGRLGVKGNGRFGQNVYGRLNSRVQEFITQDSKTDAHDLATKDSRPAEDHPVRYKAVFIRFLHTALLEVLAS